MDAAKKSARRNICTSILVNKLILFNLKQLCYVEMKYILEGTEC